MKRVLSVLLCLVLVIGCFPLTALADDITFEGDDGTYSIGETSISLTLTVPEPVVLSSITVTPPTKTEYLIGDSLDTTGMVVIANYTDDTTQDVTSAATLSGFDSSAAGQVTVTVSYTEKEVTKTATFTVTIVEPAATTYMISISADPSEGGTVSGGGTYDENASVTVTATANSGYSFVKWTENGEEVSTDANYTFSVTGNRTLVAVFEENEVIYTVTVKPGEGTGTAFTVNSSTVISRADKLAGNYDFTRGCFYLDNDGKVYYKFPTQCAFTPSNGKEFDCWYVDGSPFNGSTFSGGTELLDITAMGNFTITALYKDKAEPSSVTLSIPATININYGDMQTAFNIQVKNIKYRWKDPVDIVLFDSVFTNANNETIPFTVSNNGLNADRNDMAGWARISIYLDRQPEYPYTYQGYINITSDAWAAAKPGSYTATLRLQVGF